MGITRIFTDISAERVSRILQQIEFDGGLAQQAPQSDGRVTIIAEFPDIRPPVAVPLPSTQESKWFEIAKQEIGVKEAIGGADNSRILEYHATTTLGAKSDSVHWCSSFVNFCITKAGLQGTNDALARSWKSWGREIPDFVPGCIVVMSRGTPPSGHVGFFAGRDGSRIVLLGGNQSDAVGFASFDPATVLARRLP